MYFFFATYKPKKNIIIEAGKPTYRWSKTTSTDSSCKVDPPRLPLKPVDVFVQTLIFFSNPVTQKHMKLDRDTKERLKVCFSFLLESYKICMGCFLSVFVAHSCGEQQSCTILESFRQPSVAIALNGATFASICLLYTIELMRENWCIQHLDIDPAFPDVHLKEVAPAAVKKALLVWNNRYWKAAVASMALVVSNIVVSSIYLSQNYQGVSTVTTTASFSLLVLMKLCRSFQMAREDRHTVRARSAYMTEYTSFNILDVDQYPTFNNVVVAN